MPAACDRAGDWRKCSNTVRHFLFGRLYHSVEIWSLVGYTGIMSTKDEKKTTNEKPVSLYPLPFNEALSALLKVKPKSKAEMDKAIKGKKKRKPKKKEKDGKPAVRGTLLSPKDITDENLDRALDKLLGE